MCLRLSEFIKKRTNKTVDSVTTTYTYNAANQISNTGFAYDDAGRMTSDGTNAYTWDRENRLLSMGGIAYAYDGLGNRVSQTASSIVTEYLNDVQPGLAKVLSETVGSDVTHFVYGPRGIQAIEDSVEFWSHPVQDGLGSVRDDALGYSPFGVPDAVVSGFAFTGEMRDENGLQYHRARYYAPELGVWPSLDPLGLGNRYAYVTGNPVTRVDPSGLFDESTCTVQQGDCLVGIAMQVGVYVDGIPITVGTTQDRLDAVTAEIVRLNRQNRPIENPRVIQPGWKLWLPPNQKGVCTLPIPPYFELPCDVNVFNLPIPVTPTPVPPPSGAPVNGDPGDGYNKCRVECSKDPCQFGNFSAETGWNTSCRNVGYNATGWLSNTHFQCMDACLFGDYGLDSLDDSLIDFLSCAWASLRYIALDIIGVAAGAVAAAATGPLAVGAGVAAFAAAAVSIGSGLWQMYNEPELVNGIGPILSTAGLFGRKIGWVTAAADSILNVGLIADECLGIDVPGL
jgi:RHS repeat-associated protein